LKGIKDYFPNKYQPSIQLLHFLTKLNQNAIGGFWMKKSN
jgi:hypothetical protein